MGYESITLMGTYFQWGLGIANAIVVVRVLLIIRKGTMSIEDTNMKEVLAKAGNHVKAIVICTIIQGIIEYIKSYFF